MFLYITCDRIGNGTGGGTVTKNELEALSNLGPIDVVNPQPTQDPFEAENVIDIPNLEKYKLAHFYAGTFPKLTKKLKEKGIKISYTAAAHDIKASQEEFKILGIPYDFPHISNPVLWNQYISSYIDANLVICPSKHSNKVMQEFGCKNTTVIPHGCYEGVNYPYPKTFSVGYLGQIGPDKGVKYLIEAWAKLNYKDAVLTFAGQQSPYLIHMIRQFGGRANYNILGYVKTLDEFFKSINVYVQPSVTEGFGIEILEAMTFGRPVIASYGVGAADCLDNNCKLVLKKDPDCIAKAIDWYKNNTWDYREELMSHAKKYNWKNIRECYINTWRGMLES